MGLDKITKNIEIISSFLKRRKKLFQRNSSFGISVILSLFISFPIMYMVTENNESLIVLGIILFVCLMCVFAVIYKTENFGFYNKKEYKKLKERGLEDLIDKRELYKKSEINNEINLFDSLPLSEKKYIINSINKGGSYDSDKIVKDLVICNFKEDSNNSPKIIYKLLINYNEELKKYSNQEKVKNILIDLIEIYLKKVNEEEFFNQKNNLINLIKKDIEIEYQKKFARLIEAKINKYNYRKEEKKEIENHFNKLEKITSKKYSSKSENKKTLIKNI